MIHPDVIKDMADGKTLPARPHNAAQVQYLAQEVVRLTAEVRYLQDLGLAASLALTECSLWCAPHEGSAANKASVAWQRAWAAYRSQGVPTQEAEPCR